MKHAYLFAAGVLLVASSRGQINPHAPAIAREVTGVVEYGTPHVTTDARFRRSHIPALRTTADGRIAAIVEGGNPHEVPGFTLMAPEKLSQPMLLDSAGPFQVSNSFTVSQQGFVAFPTLTGTGMPVSHVCLWEYSPPTSNAQGQDVYDLAVFASSNYQDNPRRTQFFVTPVTIIVSNPKTPNAFISAAYATGLPVGGPKFQFEASAFEPVICGDGRLLVTRVFSSELPWTPSPTGKISADIVYSYYTATQGAPADPTKWIDLLPISHAPFDTRINSQFGFARSQFRDAAGTAIDDGEDIGGSYPWIDREAKNLFFEGVHDALHYFNGTNWQSSRYPQTTVPGDMWARYGFEDTGDHQGVTFAGLWSHGKMVQIDTLNNDMDYAIGGQYGPQQRLVTLFTPNTGPVGNEPAELLLGYGRSTERMPLGENDNANIIDSLENKFNYRKFMRPMSVRDVAWHINNSKQTDEFAFDDYVDPDAIIVANMNGLLTMPSNPGGSTNFNPLIHYSGWDELLHVFNTPVQLQNAATPPDSLWKIPPYGLVVGPGRLEPAATGGIHGKGFWMDGTTGLRFSVPTNTVYDVGKRDWYFGVFVDCRFADDAVERRLLTFPDGTSVRLLGRHQVLYATGSGAIVGRITLPAVITPISNPLDDLLPQIGWAHLAFQVRAEGKEVEFLLDGLPYGHWQHFSTSLFQPVAGDLTVGQVSGTTGFRGWIDDFKLLAHLVDPESACNHAGGTLIGLSAAYSGDWRTKFADRFPAWTHAQLTSNLQHRGELAYPVYANFHNYTADNAAYVGNIPSNTKSLRQSMHFSEGPLFHNAPRPDTRGNAFCTSCHAASGQPGLDLAALTYNGAFTATNDPRRQPAQPPAKLFGMIPAGLFQSDTSSQPPTGIIAPTTGEPVDPWLMPTYGGPSLLQSLSLLNGTTGEELALLAFGDKVDPARYGANSFKIRANLDFAQGSVAMTLDTVSVNPSFAPYVVPATGSVLSIGQHNLTAMPLNGIGTIADFEVVGNTKRTVADYHDDFQTGSAKRSWFYCWNASGQMTASMAASALQQLNWAPSAGFYTELGLAYPENSSFMPNGKLSMSGGHPGNGINTPGTGYDRFILAGYQAKIGGYYGIDAGSVSCLSALSNGLKLVIYTQTNGTMTRLRNITIPGGVSVQFANISLGLLSTGDIIWIGVGPNADDANDDFGLDFSVVYNELFF